MVSDFPRTLSMLRKEKKISQRQASAELDVSQALLSHYENGMREPGLGFVVRAADYYGVSTDFLLGRTMSKDGKVITADEVGDASLERDNTLRGSAAAMLSKKLLVNSTALFFDLLGKSEERKIAQEITNYLGLSFYKAYRLVYLMNKDNADGVFSVSNVAFSELCDSELKRSEAILRQMVAKYEKKDSSPAPDMSMDMLRIKYPNLAPSLLSLLHNAAVKISHDEKN